MKKIDISTNKYPNTFAIVDDEDYDYLNQWKWYKKNSGLVARVQYDPETRKGRTILLSRTVAKTPKGLFADHINHDRLDNRKCNLRNATRTQNNQNKKRYVSAAGHTYKCVRRRDNNGHYSVYIKVDGVNTCMCTVKNKHVAAIVYNIAAHAYFGEYACYNEVPENERRKHVWVALSEFNKAYKKRLLPKGLIIN